MSQPITNTNKRDSLFLIASIVISIALHLAEMHFLQHQALWFSSPTSPEQSKHDWTSSMGKKERDQILKEVFESAPAAQHGMNEISLHKRRFPFNAAPIEYNNLLNDTPHNIAPEISFHEILFSKSLFPEISLISHQKAVATLKPLKQNISLLPHLPREIILPAPLEDPRHSKQFPDPLTTKIQLLEELPKEILQVPPLASTQTIDKPIHASWESGRFLPKMIADPSPPSMPQIPSLSDLHAASYSNSFETELVFFEMEEGKYLFALTLIPREDLKFTPLKQNYIFLIDRSNSIQKERLAATKSAVRKAIEELKAQDQFNIIVFDQKVDKLAPSMLSATSESIAKAQNFLDKIELGSFFSQKNLYKPLFLTIPHASNPDELYTAILITDGENLAQKTMVQSLISDWTRMNQGQVSLYTLGMDEDTHLDALKSIANLNRGKAVSSHTNRGLKRKLLKLMKTIHSPLAKNLSCKVVSRLHQDEIDIFPKATHAPHLFLGEPYVILGTTHTLDDFVLFVQGRVNGEWLHIKKNVSFASAKKGNVALKSEWAQLKAFALYEQYLKGSGTHFLTEAQSLLKTHELPEIFENVH